jgi:clan AA aspartic protease
MIAGIVTPGLEAVVNVDIHGSNARLETLSAVIDTGFSGFITLPPDLIAQMGLRYFATENMVLANGSASPFRVFKATVQWHGERRVVPVHESDADALVGMALLHGSRLTMDITQNGPVRVEPIVD